MARQSKRAQGQGRRGARQRAEATADREGSEGPRQREGSGRSPRVRPVQPEVEARPDSHEREHTPDRPQFTVELVGDQLGQAMSQIVDEAQYWINRGRYNKLRISRAGKPLLPDIPVGALMAIEAATFFWAGLLRGALVNIAGNVLFEVELINDAKEHLTKGRELFLQGELDDAAREMQQALKIDDRDPELHLAYGSLLKARGERGKSIASFQRALELDPLGAHGAEAKQQLQRLGVDV